MYVACVRACVRTYVRTYVYGRETRFGVCFVLLLYLFCFWLLLHRFLRFPVGEPPTSGFRI